MENKTIEELKVIVYDCLAQKEQIERTMQMANNLIAKKYEELNKPLPTYEPDVIESTK